MSAVALLRDAPVVRRYTHTQLRDGTGVTVEEIEGDCRAFCTNSPNGIDAVGLSEADAVEALEEAITEEVARRQDLAEHGETPWWLA